MTNRHKNEYSIIAVLQKIKRSSVSIQMQTKNPVRPTRTDLIQVHYNPVRTTQSDQSTSKTIPSFDYQKLLRVFSCATESWLAGVFITVQLRIPAALKGCISDMTALLLKQAKVSHLSSALTVVLLLRS